MKNNLYLLAMVMAIIGGCKKNATRTSNSALTSYRPHMFQSHSNYFTVFDASNPDSTKSYYYRYNSSLGKYEYSYTEDIATTSKNIFPEIYYTNWPKNVTDPVLVEPGELDCQGKYYLAFYDRDASDDYAYYYDQNNSTVFKKFKFPYWFCTTGSSHDTSSTPIYGGIFGSALYPHKLDAYAHLGEEGIIIDSSIFHNVRLVDYYFDFDAGTFYCMQFNTAGDQQKVTQYLESDYIGTLVTKPYGNMDVNPIDFKKADASFFKSTPLSNHLYFLDYDEMKYVEVERFIKPAGGINLVNSDSARFNLVTTSWQPMSNLITGWKF